MKSHPFVFTGLTILLIVSCLGCGKEVGSWREIDNRSLPVSFSGYTKHPNQTVRVLVQDDLGNWETIAETTTASVASHHLGAKWYSWKNTSIIPEKCWKPWVTGFVANTKVSPASYRGKDGFSNNEAECDKRERLWEKNRCPVGVIVGVYAELDPQAGF